ncbi:MAG: VOC family protein [Rhodopila sp.]|nr:VOC family protein [Rhodopila sp.]
MGKNARPDLSHVGIYVTDIKKIETFYCDVLDLIVTDRGAGRRFKNDLVFLSGEPTKHHQLALASGRAPGTASTVMQVSFQVPTLAKLRAVRDKALANGAKELFGLNHGNAWSIYFHDPEDNVVEVYVDVPFYVPQPHGDPLDLDKSDEEIFQETEAVCRRDPGFMPLADWEARMRRLLAGGPS